MRFDTASEFMGTGECVAVCVNVGVIASHPPTPPRHQLGNVGLQRVPQASLSPFRSSFCPTFRTGTEPAFQSPLLINSEAIAQYPSTFCKKKMYKIIL